MKKILIDGRFIGVGESISRYTLEMLAGILKLDQENHYTLLVRPCGLNKAETFFESKEKFKNLDILVIDIPHYSIYEQTKLLSLLNQANFDLVHFTQFNQPILYKKNYVVTIHDLTLFGHLHRQNKLKSLAFNVVMKSAVRNSKKIISISKTTTADILDYYRPDKKKIKLIYHGLDHQTFSPSVKSKMGEIETFKKNYQVDSEYILYTGLWKRHKNLLRLFDAFDLMLQERMIKEKTKLVMVGKIDNDEPEVLEAILKINKKYNEKVIITTGFIDEAELPLAYAGAKMYIIPSLSEGFGWPPLEAMACATPVASSNISSMPEILGQAAIYFDPYNIRDMADKISQGLNDKKLLEDKVKLGLSQVKKYDWTRTARETLAVYREILVEKR